MKEFLKKLFAKKADERQEKELLRIEHYGFWIFFWLLFLSMVIQRFFLDREFEVYAAEFIIFMAGCFFIIIACVWRGVWTYQSRKPPGVKELFLWSLGGALVLGVPVGILNGMKYGNGEVKTIIIYSAATAVSVFLSCMILFLIVAALLKKRVRAMEKAVLEELNEED